MGGFYRSARNLFCTGASTQNGIELLAFSSPEGSFGSSWLRAPLKHKSLRRHHATKDEFLLLRCTDMDFLLDDIRFDEWSGAEGSAGWWQSSAGRFLHYADRRARFDFPETAYRATA